MGLSVAISGGIILTVFVLILFSLPGLADKLFSIGDITSQVTQHEQEISNTEINVDEISVLVGSSTVNFTLNNDGSEKLWNFEDFDLFIEYDDVTPGKLTEELTFSGNCLGIFPLAGNWCIQSITLDVKDPGIINTDEKATIWTRVNQNLVTSTAIVTIVTDNGVTFSSGQPGNKIYLGSDLSTSNAVAYTTIFTIPLTTSKTNMVHVELIQRSPAVATGVQSRGAVSVAQTGGCSFILANTATIMSPFYRAVAVAPTEAGVGNHPVVNIPFVNTIDCVVRADATPTNLLIEFQSETGGTTVTTELGSWYTIDVNP
ncbi:MAG: hypothetical protein ACT4NJ_08250 [Nitrosopumilaceae archaeon]